jgi:ubiquinone/menaquinone biosynthesis C-methylase UbiE
MRNMTNWAAPAIVAGYPWPKQGTICDVAGGTGTLVAAILREHAGLRAIVVDAPVVLEEADAYLEAAGVRDRVELREGDMFDSVDATADIYVLKDVLHDWDDERCARILATVRAAMPAGARLVLAELHQERNAPHQIASLVDVHMLAQCDGGRQRSIGELQGLLREAGLRPGAVHRMSVGALVEGTAGPGGA